MPSTATITTSDFSTFTAGTLIKSASINNNFNIWRGHNIPVDASVSGAANNAYDLGSTEYRWRNAYIGTNLQVSGIASITGRTWVGGAFSCAGAAAFASTVRVTGIMSCASTVFFGSNVNFATTLSVTGAATFGNTVNITGNVSMAGDLVVAGSLNANVISCSGNLSIGGGLFFEPNLKNIASSSYIMSAGSEDKWLNLSNNGMTCPTGTWSIKAFIYFDANGDSLNDIQYVFATENLSAPTTTAPKFSATVATLFGQTSLGWYGTPATSDYTFVVPPVYVKTHTTTAIIYMTIRPDTLVAPTISDYFIRMVANKISGEN